MVKESIESLAHKNHLRSGSRVKTQISRENGHKRPAPVTDSAISNTSEEEDEELGEDLGDLLLESWGFKINTRRGTSQTTDNDREE